MFNGPVNTKGFISSPFPSLIKYNNPLSVCLPLPWLPVGWEEMDRAALYSEYREKGVSYRDINVFPASLSILSSQKVRTTHQPVGPQLLHNIEMQAASASRIQCSSYK